MEEKKRKERKKKKAERKTGENKTGEKTKAMAGPSDGACDAVPPAVPAPWPQPPGQASMAELDLTGTDRQILHISGLVLSFHFTPDPLCSHSWKT